MPAILLAIVMAMGSAAAQDVAREPTGETFEDSEFPTREELPQEIVLVVKLMSAREVRPTTGVVVSDQGLVVVPAEFIGQDPPEEPSRLPEIVVLDGGGNIARHGRRARFVGRSPSGGLALLEVEGLRRTPVRLARLPGRQGDELRLGAFPPAQQMRRGMGPLWIPVRLTGNERARIFGLDPEATMPNVSGPLFNRCEQWVGYGLAAGEPSLDTRQQPIVLFADDLLRELQALDAMPPEDSCAPPADEPDAGPDQTEAPDDAAEAPPVPLVEQPSEQDPVLPLGDATEEVVPAEATDPGPLADEADRSPWSWLPPAAVALAALLGLGWWRRRGRSASPAGDDRDPDTRVLSQGRSRAPARPGSRELEDGAPPRGGEGLLVLRGQDPDGVPLSASAAVDDGGCALRVGRRDADLVIDEATVSASHALIEGRPGALTISDLGSRNGTRVAGVPCLAGERWLVDEQTVIQLGANRLRLAWIEAPERHD